MNEKPLEEYLNEIIDTAKIMLQNLGNNDILKFHAGKLSVINKAILAILIKAK